MNKVYQSLNQQTNKIIYCDEANKKDINFTEINIEVTRCSYEQVDLGLGETKSKLELRMSTFKKNHKCLKMFS